MTCNPFPRYGLFTSSAPLLAVALVCLGSSRITAQEPNGLAAAAALQEAFVKAIESAEKSVVAISRDKQPVAVAPDQRFPFPGRDRGADLPTPGDPHWVPNEFGAGIIIDDHGLILTNYHVVRGGPIEGKQDVKPDQFLYVHLPDRRGYEARIYAADPRSDLAVLKIPPVDNLKALKLGAAHPVRKGQIVVALGNPYAIARDGSASASWGIIGNIGRRGLLEAETPDQERQHRGNTIHNLGTLLQLDTRLELGTSGGALLNLQGELIGMTTSLAAIVGYEKSAGFAVPFDDSMKRIIESLQQGKEAEYGFLGVEPDDVTAAELAKPDWAPIAARIRQPAAARIRKVVDDLPAHRSGLRDGDLVLRVGDKRILSSDDLMREIGLLAPGSKVPITYFRLPSGEGRAEVEVGKWPVVDEDGIIATKPLREPWRGIVYDFSTSRRRYFAQVPFTRFSGVRVLEIQSSSPASGKNLQPGDLITQVNRAPVRSPRDFAEAVKNATGTVVLTVTTPSDRASTERPVEIKAR